MDTMRGIWFVLACVWLVCILGTLLEGEDRNVGKVAYAVWLICGVPGLTLGVITLGFIWELLLATLLYLYVTLSWGLYLSPEASIGRAQYETHLREMK